MRHSRGVETGKLRGLVLLGAMLTLVAGHAHAQKSPPPPPPPPKKGKVYPKAKDYGQPPRILRLDPDQKKIDPKLLKAAPTVDQVMRQKQAKALGKASGTPAKPKPTAAAQGKAEKTAAKRPVKPAPKSAGAKKPLPKKSVAGKSS